jgi:hypothetical protein
MWSIAAPLHQKAHSRHGHDEWHHVILTWHPEKGLKLFINGELRKEAKGEFWEQGAAGKLSNDSSIGAPSPHENGSVVVDEVRFWNMSLDKTTAEAIFEWESRPRRSYHVINKAEVKARTNFPTAPGMKYYMPMDRIESGRVIGDGINGTAGRQIRPGQNRKDGHTSMSFSGSSVIDLGDRRGECFGNIDLCFGGFSMSLWITPMKRSRSTFYAFNSGSRSPSIAISMDAGKLYIVVQSIRMKKYWQISHGFSKQERRNGWVHIAFTWRPGSLRVFIDGNRKDNGANYGSYLYRPRYVHGAEDGAQMGLRYTKRKKYRRKSGSVAIDQVRFWERTLSEREASGIYKAEKKLIKENVRFVKKRRYKRRGSKRRHSRRNKKEKKESVRAKRRKNLRERERKPMSKGDTRKRIRRKTPTKAV